jgi:putative PEP-CTERM system histidine kinase
MGASTTRQRSEPDSRLGAAASAAVVTGLQSRSTPFKLDEVEAPWGETLLQLNPTTFVTGGRPWCVPLRSGDRVFGALVLADRVGGADYTIEELELLTCIGDHTTSVLLNVRLTDEVVRAKEMEAFRTMSAFFIHDLKNAASSLHLMLKNAQVHFDDPEFRADALRTIDNAARRIDDTIARLSAVRQLPASRPADADLNEIVSETLDRIGPLPSVDLTTALAPVPAVRADRHQIQSVVTNLVLHARDALGGATGWIQVRTEHRAGRVVLSVSDNGCGMSQAFVRESLFRPFQSTKTRGLGIGLFQARAIVQAHGGTVQVDTEPGRGTTFQVALPAKDVQ